MVPAMAGVRVMAKVGSWPYTGFCGLTVIEVVTARAVDEGGGGAGGARGEVGVTGVGGGELVGAGGQEPGGQLGVKVHDPVLLDEVTRVMVHSVVGTGGAPGRGGGEAGQGHGAGGDGAGELGGQGDRVGHGLAVGDRDRGGW